jgi:hypothetical protein
LTVPARAATIVVTSAADSGPGSLRQAIADAAPGDTITFASSVNTVTLTNGDLVLRNVTIQGPGASQLTVRRDPSAVQFRVFTVNAGVTATLAALTITGGDAGGVNARYGGGGVLNAGGDLTLVDAVVSNNSAETGGGVRTLGGFVNHRWVGTLTVRRTSIINNTASVWGGGIDVEDAAVTIDQSTIAMNTSGSGNGQGGGLFALWSVADPVPLATIRNSTISGNRGSAVASSMPVVFDSTTLVSDTSPAIEAMDSGDVSLPIHYRNSILLGPTPIFFALAPVILSDGFNIVSDDPHATAGVTNAATDRVNTNAQLGPLQDNGGPTLTHALLAGSPAIDTGTCTDANGVTNTVDQRGSSRPSGPTCDIGAFEFLYTTWTVTSTADSGPGSLRQAIANAAAGDTITFAPSVTTVTLTSGSLVLNKNVTIQGPGVTVQRDPAASPFEVFTISQGATPTFAGLTTAGGELVVTSSADSGPGSLRQAIADAAAGDTIVFALTLPATITLTSDTLVLTKDVTIQGPGASQLTVRRDPSAAPFSVFGVYTNVTVTIAALTITGGEANTANFGGGISSSGGGNLTVSDAVITNNSAVSGGGVGALGVYAVNGTIGTLTVRRTSIINNTASTHGGGIEVELPTTIEQSVIAMNTAQYGSGITQTAGESDLMTIRNSTISGNHSLSAFGSAIVVESGKAALDSTTVVSDEPAAITIGDPFESWLQYRNSILLGPPPTFVTALGVFPVSDGFNIVSDDPHATAGATNAATDRVNTNAQLGPLQDNGGPTLTHALLAGSPAIDTGTCTDANGVTNTVDQRGAAHPRVAPCDVGAFEVAPPQTWTVTSSADSGPGSLRQAIVDAAPGDTIAFAPSVTMITVTSSLVLSKTITIQGPGASQLTVRRDPAASLFQIFTIAPGATPTITGLTTSGGEVLVTSAADSGPGSLRQAIADAGPGATIIFAPSVTTIALTSGSLAVRPDVTIQGPGANQLTVVRDPATDPFSVFMVPPGITPAISGLTISGGRKLLVTSSADSGPDTLRQAIADANPGDTIGFSLGSPATITLTSGTLEPTSYTTIQGPGANQLTVQRDPFAAPFRIFTVNPGVTTTIAGLSITGGDVTEVGGGILNIGGNLTLVDASVMYNQARQGGGVATVGGTSAVRATSIFKNTGSVGGGGFWISDGAAMTVQNSTISSNFASDGGAIYSFGGDITLDWTTVVSDTSPAISLWGNGAPLHDALHYRNSVFLVPDFTFFRRNIGDLVVSDGFNIVSDDPYDSVGIVDAASDGVGVNPRLGPLQDNGGPTLTHALLSGSPAIDRGSCTDAGGVSLMFDQRNMDRPSGRACDAGAFEIPQTLTDLQNNIDSGLSGLASQNSVNQVSTAVGQVSTSVGQVSTAVGQVSTAVAGVSTAVNGVSQALTARALEINGNIGSLVPLITSRATQTSVDQVSTSVGQVASNVSSVATSVNNVATSIASTASQTSLTSLSQTTGTRFDHVEASLSGIASSLPNAAALNALPAAVANVQSAVDGKASQASLDAAAAAATRIAIEQTLAQGVSMASFMLPASAGGHLDLVRQITSDAINGFRLLGIIVSKANSDFAKGETAYATGDFRTAYAWYASAYQQLLK